MIEIIELNPINDSGKPTLIGEAVIRIPKLRGLILESVKVFNKNGTRWISLPSRKKDDGKYHPYIRFDTKELNDALRDAFFKSYDEYVNKNTNRK